MDTRGMVRRIDELGRIVIPKEIRKILRLYEGSKLKIDVQKSGEIILSKFSNINNLNEYSNIMCDLLSLELDCNVFICDMNNIISSSKKGFIGKTLNENVVKNFLNRKNYILQKNESMMISIFTDDKNLYNSQAIIPIISESDVIGGIILYTLNEKELTINDIKCTQIIAHLLGEL